MMRARHFHMVVLLALLCLTIVTPAQTPEGRPTGSVTGRIMLGNQPAPGVEVMLTQAQPGITGVPDLLQLSAVSDAEGRYRITGVPVGSFRVVAYAPAYIIAGEDTPWQPGKAVNVAEGETVENVNFSLTRGGVITGHLTDADGKPVIAERVRLTEVDEFRRPVKNQNSIFTNYETDDRGEYRIFGLRPGWYLISAGSSPDEVMIRMGRGAHYRRTWHPDVTEEAQAKVIAVTAGSVAEDVDIRLERAAKGYAVSGRVIDAESGRPIAGAMIQYAIIKEGSASMGMGGSVTNAEGEFRLEGLAPNTYQMSAQMTQNPEYYSDSATAEVVSGDVSGIEVKVQRGATLSGVAVIEGTTDPAIVARLAQATVSVQTLTQERMMINTSVQGNVSRDGTFVISGIRPGKVRLYPGRVPGGQQSLSLARLERNGAEFNGELEISPGEQVSGIRVVFAYGTSVIAGRVEVRGGTWPEGARISVALQRQGSDGRNLPGGQSVSTDNRGQFVLSGIAPGNYKVRATLFNLPSQSGRRPPFAEQSVTVSADSRQELNLVIDLSQPEGKERD